MNELAARTASVELMVSLARLFAEVELPDRAESMWTRVLELRPGDPELREEWKRVGAAWLREGKISYRESFVDGLENAPAALMDVLAGRNFGKHLVRV